jgi:hypothetical protein
MHEKERISTHALLGSPATGLSEYMKRKCAQMGASPLTCRSLNEMLQFSEERLVSVDAEINLGREGMPRRPSVRISPRKNAAIISKSAPHLPRFFRG